MNRRSFLSAALIVPAAPIRSLSEPRTALPRSVVKIIHRSLSGSGSDKDEIVYSDGTSECLHFYHVPDEYGTIPIADGRKIYWYATRYRE